MPEELNPARWGFWAELVQDGKLAAPSKCSFEEAVQYISSYDLGYRPFLQMSTISEMEPVARPMQVSAPP